MERESFEMSLLIPVVLSCCCGEHTAKLRGDLMETVLCLLQIVLLAEVLTSSATSGYDYANRRVHTFNGTKILNLKHLVTLVYGCTDRLMRFGLHHHVMPLSS